MRRFWMISVVCCSLPACGSIIAHSPQAAADAATQFAQVALVDRDHPEAYRMLAPSFIEQTSEGLMSERIIQMHPKAFPAQVTATDFETMPGQRGMMIYLKGTRDNEVFFYRFVMEGDAASGYRVSGLFRGNGPHPSTRKQPMRSLKSK